MGDVLVALAWLVGALAIVGLLVWGSLRGAMKAARTQREGARRDRGGADDDA